MGRRLKLTNDFDGKPTRLGRVVYTLFGLILMLIVLIPFVLAVQGIGSLFETPEHVKNLRTDVRELKKTIDAQNDQIRSLKEQIQGHTPAPKADAVAPKD
jgi:hypothetical protein